MPLSNTLENSTHWCLWGVGWDTEEAEPGTSRVVPPATGLSPNPRNSSSIRGGSTYNPGLVATVVPEPTGTGQQWHWACNPVPGGSWSHGAYHNSACLSPTFPLPQPSTGACGTDTLWHGRGIHNSGEEVEVPAIPVPQAAMPMIPAAAGHQWHCRHKQQ